LPNAEQCALFAGSDGGAEHWAIIASLIETCNLNDVDPLTYLTHVLIRIINGHPNSEIDQLIPWACGGDVKLLSVTSLWTGLSAALPFAVLLAIFFSFAR
jgi:hypothetical protein